MKIDGFSWVHAARGLASTELSFHPCKYCVIVAGAFPGETKMWAAVPENDNILTVVNYTICAAIID